MDDRKDRSGESAIGAGAGSLAGPLAGLDGGGLAAAAEALGPPDEAHDLGGDATDGNSDGEKDLR